MALNQCRMVPSGRVKVSPALEGVRSPLQWEVWQEHLRSHPDRDYAEYLICGLRDGFRIGFDYQGHKCRSSRENMRSAVERPEVVREYIEKECIAGRLLGPLDPALFPEVHTSRFGVIPKSDPGGWRLIVDLSAPEGASVNDGISREVCSLSYMTVDDAARVIEASGWGAYLAKVDIKNAYRIIPVHPEDRALLGMQWEGALYVDAALPFGLRSAPKIFTSVADALEWMLRERGVRHVFHYLDDFLIVAPPQPEECQRDLWKLLQLFSKLGVPVAEEKREGPSTQLTFLGIELDTREMVRRLPRKKVSELRDLVKEWSQRKSCLVKDLQSLVGKLMHACKVVRPGRSFLGRMLELLRGGKRKQQFLRLNSGFRSDLQWWNQFLEIWNGVSMLANTPRGGSDIDLYTDASGSFGCGAWWREGWLQLEWPEGLETWSIARKELIPIVMACMLWGNKWWRKAVRVHCDNEAVVEVLQKGCARDGDLMHLLRCVFFITAFYETSLKAVHIPGTSNTVADAISRNNMVAFQSQVPHIAAIAPTGIPPAAVSLLIQHRPDWTSVAWSQLFKNFLQQE